MLVGIVQRETSVEVSYVDNRGLIKLLQLPLPKEGYTNWKITEEFDEEKSLVFRNHDGQPVKKVPGRQFIDLNLHEFLTKRISKEHFDLIHAPHKPMYFSVDIETEITDKMPDAETAPTKILSISITAPTLATIVLHLKEANLGEIQSIVNEHMSSYIAQGKTFPVQQFVFNDERSMLEYFLMKMNQVMHTIGGWFFDGYDWPYIVNRCKKNGLNVKIASPSALVTKDDYPKPVHRLVLDHKHFYQEASKGTYLTSFSLESIATHELGLGKLPKTMSLKNLYLKKYDRFIAYNAIDTITDQLIYQKAAKIDTLFNMAYYCHIPIIRADGKIAQADACIFEELYLDNRVYADEPKKIERQSYSGGFVKSLKKHVVRFPTGYDAKSLYPSTMKRWNLSPDNYLGKCKKSEVAELRRQGFIVTELLSVYKNDKPYLYKRIETKLSDERQKYKDAKAMIYEHLSTKIEQEAKRRKLSLKT